MVNTMPPFWTVAGASDFNGDGTSDILWQNGSSLSMGTGFYIGGSLGALNASNTFTNLWQITLCPPFCMRDFTPNPIASASSSAFYGNVFLGYNQQLLNTPLIVGVEGFWGDGGADLRYTGIPGTFGPGGITTAAGAIGDSVTLTPTWNAGILGTIGTTFQLGVPVYMALNLGVAWQHFNLGINCTGPAGACGGNGILLQTLSASTTATGFAIGGELSVKMASVLPPVANYPLFNNALIGFRYLHVDYESFTSTLGNPAQFQLTSGQKLTTNSAMAKFTLPLSAFWTQGINPGLNLRY
jgi:hypothetical protein